jgi:hypothetical protein
MADGSEVAAGMRIGKGNGSTRRNPAPLPLFPPQIPHYLTWDGTRTAVVGDGRLTAPVMSRPILMLFSSRSTLSFWEPHL